MNMPPVVNVASVANVPPVELSCVYLTPVERVAAVKRVAAVERVAAVKRVAAVDVAAIADTAVNEERRLYTLFDSNQQEVSRVIAAYRRRAAIGSSSLPDVRR